MKKVCEYKGILIKGFIREVTHSNWRRPVEIKSCEYWNETKAYKNLKKQIVKAQKEGLYVDYKEYEKDGKIFADCLFYTLSPVYRYVVREKSSGLFAKSDRNCHWIFTADINHAVVFNVKNEAISSLRFDFLHNYFNIGKYTADEFEIVKVISEMKEVKDA